jgi:CHAD domain-containing protein
VAYAIERDETLHAAILRIMDEQIIRARDTLADPKLSAEKRVHEARKRFKEIRALLRMIRKPLGDPFAIENAWFRDAARTLASARDADAMLEAIDKLPLHKITATRARKTLDAQRTQHPPLEPIIAKVIDQLALAQARPALWPQFANSFDTIADGLQRTYRNGRRAMQHHETPEQLHEWRKRVKEHWYHVQLLRNIWPDMMKAYAEVLSDLSHLLGDHHDLHVLREQAGAHSPTLRKTIDARQDELEKKAMEIGRRVYAEKPSAWLARMRNTWSTWTIAS